MGNQTASSAIPPLFTTSLVFIRFAIQSVESRGIFRSVSRPLSTSSIVAVPPPPTIATPSPRERNIRFDSVQSPRGIELTIPSFVSPTHEEYANSTPFEMKTIVRRDRKMRNDPILLFLFFLHLKLKGISFPTSRFYLNFEVSIEILR